MESKGIRNDLNENQNFEQRAADLSAWNGDIIIPRRHNK